MNSTNLFSSIKADNLTSVISSVLSLIKKFPIWLDSLPVSRSVSLSIGGILLVFLILGITCLCCRYVCFQNARKKDMNSKIDLRKQHLFGPDYAERIIIRTDELDYNIDGTEGYTFEEIKLGQIKYSIIYNNEENILHVTIHEVKNIPSADISGLSDPFVKVFFKPTSKKEFKTTIKKNTLSPVYEETFSFKEITYTKFTQSEVWLKVFDFDRFGSSDILGEAKIPVREIDISKGSMTEWRILIPEFRLEMGYFNKKISSLGYICLGLGYSLTSGFLAVFVLSCKDLTPMDENGYADPYVIIFLILDGKKIKKRKTTVKMRTLNPIFNDRFAFEVEHELVEEISVLFIVADYDKGEPGAPIGQCIIGQLGQGLGIKHWNKVRSSPGKPVCFWHRLRPTQFNE